MAKVKIGEAPAQWGGAAMLTQASAERRAEFVQAVMNRAQALFRSGQLESADLLLFLMKRPNPSPAIVAAVRDGIGWLKAHALYGVEWTRDEPGSGGRKLIAKDGAGPLWSRYYDIATGKPIFGDRDKTVHDDVNELSEERRNGYSWFNAGPAKAVSAFDRWAPASARQTRG